jgi:LPS export ABC transporter protein LptC
VTRRALLSLAWVALAVAGCFRAAPDDAGATSPPPSPGITLEGAQLTETRDGQKIWDLTARKVAYQTAPQVAELVDVKTRFYEDGIVVSTGEAPRATFYLTDRRLQLAGGIQVRAEGGAAGFSADAVTVVPDPGRLTAEGAVTFFRGPNRMTAKGLVADRSLRRVELGGGVVGTFALTPDGTPVVPLPSQGI